ncbi:MAG TPA: histidine kinase [Mycobacteriales bacterium]|nr:histidine kinase [Mycobacteriales bacterium]
MAAVLAVGGTAETALGLTSGPAGVAAVVLAPLIALPLAWRRVSPRGAAAACFAATLAQAAVAPVSVAGATTPLVLLLATYSVAARSRLRDALLAGGLIAFATIAIVLLDPDPDVGDAVYAVTVMAVGWTFGRTAALRYERAELLAERARWLETDRERAVAQERVRIARELHDVVAHRVSGIVLHAAAASRDPAGRPAALDDIADEGRRALAELRQLLGVLRHGETGSELAPQPGLDDLADLVAEQRTRGLDAKLEVIGQPKELPPAAAIAVYRVVQESLTNSRRHGGPCDVDVRLEWRGDRLRVEVQDRGRPSSGQSPGARLGLVGMQERLEVHGGRIEAGPRRDGGFSVVAELPL